jgi:CRISPR-associated protein Cas2
MMVLITYDVATESEGGQRRLRHVARECENFGQRVQKSVFECLVDPPRFALLKDRLIKLIDPEQDSLRFYFLGDNWKNRVEQIGAGKTYDPEGPLIA